MNDPMKAATDLARNKARHGFELLKEASDIEIAVRHARIAWIDHERKQAIAKLQVIVAMGGLNGQRTD
jgi:outer membrane protein TolC